MKDKKEQESSVAYKLSVARINAGLSQGQTAKLLNMHRPTISEIEAGRRKVSIEELKLFSKIYDVSLQWLLEDSVEVDDRKWAKIELAARELTKLKKDDLNKVLNLLKTLKLGENG